MVTSNLHREGVGEVEGEDENVQEHQAGEGGVTVSDLAGQRTSDEDTDQRAQLAAALQGRLPGRGDNVLLLELVPDTVIFGEGGKGDEVAHEEHVVRLHDDGAGHLSNWSVEGSSHWQ